MRGLVRETTWRLIRRSGEIECEERLGGLLKHYVRRAA
jgi:hypothetical protein